MTGPSLIDRLKASRLVQALLLYLGASWVVVEVAGELQDAFDLPDWLVPVAIVLLLVGLVVVLATAWVQANPATDAREAAGEVPDSWEVGVGDFFGDIRRGRFPHLTWGRAILGGVFALSLLFGIAGAFVLLRGGSRARAVPELAADEAGSGLAVVPFTVSGAEPEVFREGMITLLATTLDGVAGLRAVDSRTVLARWDEVVGDRERPDLPRVLEVARRAGARYVLIGSAVGAGSDVGLVAEVYDVEGAERLGTARAQGSPDSLMALADQLSLETVRVILAEGRADAELQHVSSLMTTSLEALRAYLEGERAYRVSAWDDARAAYERAVGYDSTFALAHLRAAQTIGWGDAGSAAVFRHQAAAQRFGERLPNREQALLAALSGVSRADVSALSEAEAAVRRYPDDPDLWNALGELQFHVGQKAMRPVEDALESLEQAASLAPDVAPYWIHIVDYQLSYGDSAAAAEALEQQRRLLKDTVESGIYLRHRAGFDLLHGDSASRAQALALIRDRTVYPSSAMRGPERLEASEAWWRALWEEEPRAGPRYATVLSDRGRMRAALALFPRSTQTGAMLRQTAVEFGFFPADSVRDLNWEGDEVGRAFSAISLQEPDAFARHRAALAEEVREWRERNPDSENGPGDFWLSFLDARWRWAMEGAAAVEDSVLAIYERSPTGSADYLLFMMGVLYDELGNDRAAFERYRAAAQTIPLAALRAARLADRLGDADEARRLYQELLIAWADADPEFQPWLEEARGWLERVPG